VLNNQTTNLFPNINTKLNIIPEFEKSRNDLLVVNENLVEELRLIEKENTKLMD